MLFRCCGGPIGKCVVLVSPRFLCSAWDQLLWCRATVIQGLWRSEISELPSIQRSRQNNRGRKIAENLRSRYKEYFCGECAVDWQEKMIRLDQIVFKMCKSINAKTFIELIIGNVCSVKRYIIFTYK